MLVAGVDVGATYVRCVLSENGKFLGRRKEPTNKKSRDSIASQIVEMIRSLLKEKGIERVEKVGIASAGPLDLKRGAVVNSPNLGFSFIPLVKPVGEELNTDVTLVNDCVAAAVGEWKFGSGKKHNNLVYITISTGIGAGVIVDGHILMGKDGNAHEIGHVVIDMEGRLTCGCGAKGHWEAYCSGRNIPNYVRMRLAELGGFKESWLSRLGDPQKITAKDIFEGCKRGDKFCKQMVEEIGRMNAIGVANAVNAYDPSLISLGGSVVFENKELVLRPIKQHMREYLLNRGPKIVVTPLGEDVVLYGAVAVAAGKI
jgi:glucokinase